ncbi:PGF-CTERM sorting domain-containing protein [Halomicrobium urmianum]|uniref:PGF-CTERM sorting domain-containing protein n=1 Tax=Halomicrobium urmianum TaxID=1586233 RepID=UPI001CD9580B|nr:PGF-CTERM sorting domain-containing protein [Halomicrobium urmianum]
MTGPPRGQRTPTRRSVLRTCAAGLGLAAGATSVASAQEDDALQDAVIPAQEQQFDQNLVGFWIHIGATVDPLEASISDRCDFVDWGDDDTLAYDAQLIDKTADPEQSSITLYLNQKVDISPGTLFIINENVECESGYMGVRLERVGMDLQDVRAAEPASPTETVDDGEGGGAEGPVDGAGPGFGVAGALAGLTGAGWLLRKRDGE